MRFPVRSVGTFAECDWTPMIDMTFQLIAFFMVLLNFSDAEVNQTINLPSAELAKPPDTPVERPLTLQVTQRGTVLYAGEELPIPQMRGKLLLERRVLEAQRQRAADATVIIRAHRRVPSGMVQELILLCQEEQFQKFKLRARQETPGA